METSSHMKELNKRNKQMDAKKFLVSFVMLVSVLFLAGMASAQELAENVRIEVNGIQVSDAVGFVNPAIIVGDSLLVRVEFDATVNAQDIVVRAELDGNKKSVREQTNSFDIEDGNRYVKTLAVIVPFDLKDKLSDVMELSVRISGDGLRDDLGPFTLRVQRGSYNLEVLSVNTPQTISAGELFPVDVVLRNIGYNDLSNLFVTAKIPALNIERTSYFGDLVAIQCDEDAEPADNYGVDIDRKCIEGEDDTASGRLFLQVPYNVKPGTYTLEVKVESEDTALSQTVQIAVGNSFSEGYFFVSGNQLLIINPTNELAVYRFVPQSTSDLSVRLSENLVSVPAGASKTIMVEADSKVSGTQTYSVSVFTADGKLVDTLEFTESFDGTKVTSPIAVLTIILAIIFIVLLVVLIVVVGKKPSKEEYSESYY